jgi:hypothetical protein
MNSSKPGSAPAISLHNSSTINPLLRYTLQGQSARLQDMAVEQIPLLGNICLAGQGTVFCAPPNAGKTLITLSLIIEAIEVGRIAGDNVFYVNADDTTQGIADKVRILDEYGAHMLAQGYLDFQAPLLTGLLEQMIVEGSARGKFLILDTFKKFTQPMSKSETSAFTNVIWRFVLGGGSLLCLSHTNKKPDADGKNIFAGVSDIIDDLDCAYVIDVMQDADGKRIATFTNKKRRGNTPDAVAYGYSADPSLSYIERLTSVVESDTVAAAEEARGSRVHDDEILHDLALFIRHGTDIGKMELVRAAAGKLSVTKRRVLKLLERYTGDDPSLHRWTYAVRDRGRHSFVLLTSPPGA